MTRRKLIALAAILAISVGVYATMSTAGFWQAEEMRTHFKKDVWVSGDTILAGGLSLNPSSAYVGLTSPTATFSVSGKDNPIYIYTDANLTGVRPTGGALNQVIILKSGPNGANTMRFDDGAYTALGANFTITEGQDDTLVLMCTNSGGTTWAKLGGNDN